MGEKKTGIGKLIDAAADFREQEREAHLELEDATTFLVGFGTPRLSGADWVSTEDAVRCALENLKELRVHPGAAVVEAAQVVSRTKRSLLEELKVSIEKFEQVYEGLGAAGRMMLINPDSGDFTNVELIYETASDALFVRISSAIPIQLRHAPPMVMACAAYHLPDFAVELDEMLSRLNDEIRRGTHALDAWLMLDDRGDADEA